MWAGCVGGLGWGLVPGGWAEGVGLSSVPVISLLPHTSHWRFMLCWLLRFVSLTFWKSSVFTPVLPDAFFFLSFFHMCTASST